MSIPPPYIYSVPISQTIPTPWFGGRFTAFCYCCVVFVVFACLLNLAHFLVNIQGMGLTCVHADLLGTTLCLGLLLYLSMCVVLISYSFICLQCLEKANSAPTPCSLIGGTLFMYFAVATEQRSTICAVALFAYVGAFVFVRLVLLEVMHHRRRGRRKSFNSKQ